MSIEDLETDKKKIIAEAAFDVFVQRGFRKTSMQLIAEKAGMSRPALYLHFQNKEDVFGYLAINYLSQVAADISSVLAVSGSPIAVLQSVFDAFDPGGVKEILLDAKHGGELIEIKSGSAKAKAEQIATEIRSAVSAWLGREAATQNIICDTPDLSAQLIMSSYYGLMNPPPSYPEYKARTAQLAQMLGRGLQNNSR